MVDEQDVPVVVRTLFKAARERDSAMVVSRVRAECAGLGPTALAVLVAVLADSFSFNEVNCFILSLFSSQRRPGNPR